MDCIGRIFVAFSEGTVLPSVLTNFISSGVYNYKIFIHKTMYLYIIEYLYKELEVKNSGNLGQNT